MDRRSQRSTRHTPRQGDRHRCLETGRDERLSRRFNGKHPICGCATKIKRSPMMRAEPNWPLVFEEIERVFQGVKRVFKSIVKTYGDGLLPVSFDDVHFILLWPFDEKRTMRIWAAIWSFQVSVRFRTMLEALSFFASNARP
jgi:hypothetical protein